MIKENSFSHELVIVRGLVSPPSKNKNTGALKNNSTKQYNKQQAGTSKSMYLLSIIRPDKQKVKRRRPY